MCLNYERTKEAVVYTTISWTVYVFSSHNITDFVEYGDIECNWHLVNHNMIQLLDFSLPIRLTTYEPTQSDKIALQTEHSNLGFTVGEVVPNKTYELHVIKVHDLLRILFIGQINQHEFTVVRNIAFVT